MLQQPSPGHRATSPRLLHRRGRGRYDDHQPLNVTPSRDPPPPPAAPAAPVFSLVRQPPGCGGRHRAQPHGGRDPPQQPHPPVHHHHSGDDGGGTGDWWTGGQLTREGPLSAWDVAVLGRVALYPRERHLFRCSGVSRRIRRECSSLRLPPERVPVPGRVHRHPQEVRHRQRLHGRRRRGAL